MSFQEFYNEDCFVNMKGFKDKSINLILTSPFYNTNKKSGEEKYARKHRNQKGNIFLY